MNTNDIVRVTLTEYGRSILSKYIDKTINDLNLPTDEQETLRRNLGLDASNRLVLQMHKLMQIFGAYCFVGNNNAFIDNTIELDI